MSVYTYLFGMSDQVRMMVFWFLFEIVQPRRDDFVRKGGICNREGFCCIYIYCFYKYHNVVSYMFVFRG